MLSRQPLTCHFSSLKVSVFIIKLRFAMVWYCSTGSKRLSSGHRRFHYCSYVFGWTRQFAAGRTKQIPLPPLATALRNMFLKTFGQCNCVLTISFLRISEVSSFPHSARPASTPFFDKFRSGCPAALLACNGSYMSGCTFLVNTCKRSHAGMVTLKTWISIDRVVEKMSWKRSAEPSSCKVGIASFVLYICSHGKTSTKGKCRDLELECWIRHFFEARK